MPVSMLRWRFTPSGTALGSMMIFATSRICSSYEATALCLAASRVVSRSRGACDSWNSMLGTAPLHFVNLTLQTQHLVGHVLQGLGQHGHQVLVLNVPEAVLAA